MKKRQPAAQIPTSTGVSELKSTQFSSRKLAASLDARRDPVRAQCRVNYISGDVPSGGAIETPRLFIRGVNGGSMKTDLRGVGVKLSEAAFAYCIPDESLKNLGIHSGDIAIIDPVRDMMRTGNLILLELNGRSVVRRLSKRGGVWLIDAADGTKPKLTPLIHQPLCGLVIGFTRLFKIENVVDCRGTSANVGKSCQRSPGSPTSTANRRKATSSPSRGTSRYPIAKRVRVVLAAEKRAAYVSSKE